MNRIRPIAAMLLGPVLLVALLAGCGQGTTSASGAATGVATATATAAIPPTATARPTATPFFVNGVGYQRVTDSMFGFSFAIPADMQLNLQESTPQNGGDHVIWMSADSNAPTAMEVDFGGGVANFQPNQCPGAISSPLISVVTVGSGIKAYQTNSINVTPTTSQGGAFVPSISVSFVSNGIVVGINLIPQTQGTPDQRMATYGPIWREMLASFTPGTVVNPTPPCGA